MPARLFKRLQHLYALGPLAHPILDPVDNHPTLLAADLGGLGCPGFIHLLPRRWLNPAQLLLLALCHHRLQPKLAEALPWVAVEYADLDWPWLVDRAKLADCQNRLGFVVTLARQIATRRQAKDVGRRLGQIEGIIEDSKLAREDAFGLGQVPAERLVWLRDNRSDDARKWNVLSDLRLERLQKYVVPDYH